MTGRCDDPRGSAGDCPPADPFSAAALDRAFARCIRRKRGRPDAIAFRLRQAEECHALGERLRSGRYAPGPGKVFVTRRPKHREIHAAAFRDRVVHHLLYDVLEPRFEPGFIGDSFACRRGKGTHAGAARLQEMMRQVTRQGARRAYALQLDIRSFFMSIHKPTLLGLLRRRFTPAELAAATGPWPLTRTVVLHDPVTTARRCGRPREFSRVPPHKRLGAAGPDRGLPIGNLTSQFFANVYLDALDQFVKRTLGARHYVRYVDDFVLLSEREAQLREWEGRIRRFLAERLRLEAHPPKLAPVSRGVDFLGYVVRPGYVLPRRRVVKDARARVAALEGLLRWHDVPRGQAAVLRPIGRVAGPLRVQRLDEAAAERLRSVWASLEAHMRHADAGRLWVRLWREHPVSRAVLAPGPSRRRAGRTAAGRRCVRVGRTVHRRFALARPAPSFPAQVERLRRGVTGLLVVQVGAYGEVPAGRLAWSLGLRWSRRRGGRKRRVAGVPWVLVPGLIRRALDRGIPVTVAVEGREAAGNVKDRRLAYRFMPVAAPPKRKVAARVAPRMDERGQMFLPGMEEFTQRAAHRAPPR